MKRNEEPCKKVYLNGDDPSIDCYGSKEEYRLFLASLLVDD